MVEGEEVQTEPEEAHQYGRVAVVVFLRGGRPTYGPKAAEIAGRMYRNLYDHSFFAATTPVRSAGAAVGVSQ